MKAKQKRDSSSGKGSKKQKKQKQKPALNVTPGGINELLKAWIAGRPPVEGMRMMHHVLGHFFGALTQTLGGMGEVQPGLVGFEKGAALVAEMTGTPAVKVFFGTNASAQEEKVPSGAEEVPIAQAETVVNITLQPLTGEAIARAANQGAARVEA